MSTIEDLKKEGRRVSATIELGPQTVEKKENFSGAANKEIVLENPNTMKMDKVAASIQMGTPSYDRKPAHEVPMSVNTGNKKKSGRVEANFSTLKADESEKLGVEVKTSPTDEIFGPGGPFDQYVAEKTEEVKNWYATEVEKAKAKAEEDELKKEEAEMSEEQSEAIRESEEDLETTIIPATNGRIIDVTRKDKKPDMKINNVDTKTFEEEVKEEPLYEEDDFGPEEEPENVEEPEEEELPTRELHDATEVISEEPIKEEPKEEPKKKETSSREKIERVTRRIMSIDLDEEEDEEEDIETEEDDNIEILRSLISEKIVPVSKKLDISSFAIAKKATASNNIFESKEAAISKWVLPATGICILLREISGSNLETMRSLLSRRIPDMRGVLKIIYDHIVSPKPDAFEVWLKSIAFADYDHLFMAIYIAAFAEANFLPIDCAECKKPYLTENMDIMDMVKFKDDKTEAKFNQLYNAEPVNPNGLYVTENVAISEKFAIAFKEPSLYSVLIESQYFDDKYNRKYQQAIALMPYVDEIYYIDMQNRTLVPVEFKLYANDPSKTARAKIKKIDAILNTFNVDENAVLSTYTDKINTRSDWFTYRIPETTCPNCKHENPAAEDQSASSLVFLRNRLGALATT